MRQKYAKKNAWRCGSIHSSANDAIPVPVRHYIMDIFRLYARVADILPYAGI
jgi:hypothetical protein